MLPELFRIGSFFMPTYGVLVTLGFLAGLWLTARLCARAGLPADPVVNLGIYTAIGGLLGAKLLMFAMDYSYYLEHPGALFSLESLQAAGIFYGGFIAALLIAFLYTRRMKLPGLRVADAFAPGIALGHAIGRVGCFMAGCCWGAECSRPWAVTFTAPRAHELVGVPLGIPLHPTQLYEALAEAAIFLVLYRFYVRAHRAGAVIGLYLLLYGSVRFAVEFVRAHDAANPYYGPLVIEQWIALALAAAGLWLVLRRGEAVPAA